MKVSSNMSEITTDKLPEEVKDLKIGIEKLIKEFNTKTALQVSSVLVEGIPTKENFKNTVVIAGYNTIVNIEL